MSKTIPHLLIKKNLFFLLLFFYVNFPFSFKSIHFIQDLSVLTISCMVIVLNLKMLFEKFKLLRPDVLIFFLMFAFLTILSVVYPFIRGTNDLSMFSNVFFSSIQLVVTNVALVIIYFKLFKEEASFERLVYFYILTCILYITITFILVLLPTLKNQWVSLLYISERDINHMQKAQYAMRVGIDGFSGFKQTFRFSVGLVLLVHKMIEKIKKMEKISTRDYIFLILLSFGTVMYGRIGSVVAALSILILIGYFVGKPRSLNIALGTIIGAVFILVLLLTMSVFVSPIRVWVEWAFEMFFNLFRSGEFSSVSTSVLFGQMYFVPDLKSFLIGNGLFTDPVTGSYYMSTDVGFMRNILFYGFIPTSLLYFSAVYLVSRISKLLKLDKKSGTFFFILVLILFFVFEIKGAVYQYIVPVLLPFYFTLLNRTTIYDSETE